MGQIMMDARYMVGMTPVEHVLEHINEVEVVTHKPTQAGGARPRVAVTGQSLEKVMPWAVERDSMGYYNVDTDAVVPVLIQAIKELKEELDAIKPRRRTAQMKE